MTYRYGRSYLRFPGPRRRTGGKGIAMANMATSKLIRHDKIQPHFQYTAAVTSSQNVFEAAAMEE